MSQEPSKKPDWEHWPGRRQPDADQPLRHRLKSLFTPTDHDDHIEQLVAARGRELEVRVEQLAEAVADVERREEKVRRLRIAVEEMLRHGSAELDDRHAELTELASELGERDARLAELEGDVDARRRELGAVELHRAAVERRETAAAERETAFEEAAASLRERESALLNAEQRVQALLERQSALEASEVELVDHAARLETREGELATDAARLDGLARQLEQRERELVARSNELDADLTTRAAALERRAGELDELEQRLAQRLAEAEASRLSFARAADELAAREQRVADIEERAAALQRKETQVERREAELDLERRHLLGGREQLARAVASVASGLGLDAIEATPPAPAQHLLFVPGERYRLVVVDDAPTPAPGDVVVLDDRPHVVVRVTTSPLPGDLRRCAILETATREQDTDAP